LIYLKNNRADIKLYIYQRYLFKKI